MEHSSYCFRLRRRWRRSKVFRLRSYSFFILLRCIKILKRGFRTREKPSCGRSSSKRELLVAKGEQGRLRSCVRSNSFHAEAIADCLEFIKMNSVSGVEDESVRQG